MKVLHQSLTMINHANIHEPDLMVLPCEEVWPSSDIDHTDSPHDNLDTSHDSDNGMLVEVPDIDFDAVDGGDQGKLLKSKAKAKGRRGPGDHRNVDPGLDAFVTNCTGLCHTSHTSRFRDTFSAHIG